MNRLIILIWSFIGFSYVYAMENKLIHQFGKLSISKSSTIGQLLISRSQDEDINVKTITDCLKYGADPNKADENGLSAFHHICSNSNNPKIEVFKIFLEYGADPNKADADGLSPLHHICNTPNNSTLEVFKIFRDYKADFNKPDNDGFTPLYYYCESCNELNNEIIKLFIENGADINAKTYGQDTIANLILKSQMSSEFRYENGMTDLHMLTCHVNPDLKRIEQLLRTTNDDDNNSDDNDNDFFTPNRTAKISLHSVEDESGNQPLHYACMAKTLNLNLINLLIENDSDLLVLNHAKKAPIDYLIEHFLINKQLKHSQQQQQAQKRQQAQTDTNDGETQWIVRYSEPFAQEQRRKSALSQLLRNICKNKTVSEFELVYMLIMNGADPDAADEKGNTALHYTCMNRYLCNHIDKMRSDSRPDFSHITVELPKIEGESRSETYGLATLSVLLMHGGNLDLKNKEGITPARYLLNNGSYRLKDGLFKAHYEKNNALNYMLINACQNEKVLNYPLINNMLELGANPQAQDNEGNTAVHYLCQNKALDQSTFQQVREKGGDLNTPNKKGITAAEYLTKTAEAQIESPAYHIWQQLQQESIYAKNQLKAKNLDDDLRTVCQKETIDIEPIISLLEHKADPQTQDKQGNTALHYACSNKNITLKILMLLLYGRTTEALKIKNIEGKTPFENLEQNSALYDHKYVNKYIIKMMLDKDISRLNTSLEKKYTQLMQNEVSSEQKYEKKNTLLHLLCKDPHVTGLLVETLLSKIQGVNEENEEGITPFYEACANPHSTIEVIKILGKKVDDFNKKTKQGLTPLHAACLSKKPNIEIIEYLIKSGANIFAFDNNKVTPLHYACQHCSDVEVINFLINSSCDQ